MADVAAVFAILEAIILFFILITAIWYFFLRPRYGITIPRIWRKNQRQQQSCVPEQRFMPGSKRSNKIAASNSSEFVMAWNAQSKSPTINSNNFADINFKRPTANLEEARFNKPAGPPPYEDPKFESRLEKNSFPIVNPYAQRDPSTSKTNIPTIYEEQNDDSEEDF